MKTKDQIKYEKYVKGTMSEPGYIYYYSVPSETKKEKSND
jgi:hypothetical protein